MWADPVAFFQTLRRRLEAFTAPPLLPEDFVNTRELQPQISGCCGIHHQSAEWGSASPQIPRPRSQDKLPFLPSLSLGSVKLSSFEEEYLAHSVYIQGVSDSRCLLSHQLAYDTNPKSCPAPPNLARGGCAMCEFQKYGWKVMAVGNCSFIMACETKKIQDLLWDQGKKPTRDRKCKTDLREGEGEGFLISL